MPLSFSLDVFAVLFAIRTVVVFCTSKADLGSLLISANDFNVAPIAEVVILVEVAVVLGFILVVTFL